MRTDSRRTVSERPEDIANLASIRVAMHLDQSSHSRSTSHRWLGAADTVPKLTCRLADLPDTHLKISAWTANTESTPSAANRVHLGTLYESAKAVIASRRNLASCHPR